MAGKKRPKDNFGIEMTIDAINKEFGEGSLFSIGTSGRTLVVPKRSSGSAKLDQALGGGYPKGRVIEVFGPESAGKCLTGDTFIRTVRGWRTIEEIFVSNEVVPSCSNKITPKEVELVNRFGKFEKTRALVNSNRKVVVELTTFSGSAIKSTRQHPHLVFSKNGYQTWKRAEDLGPGDYLICDRQTDCFGPGAIDLDVGYLLGVAIADACFGESRWSFTNDDPFVKDCIFKIGSTFFGVNPNVYDNNGKGSEQFHFNSKERISEIYKEFGFTPGLAKDKNFGALIRSLNRESLKSVLRGYVDCECSIDKEKRCLEVTSASELLLIELKLILQQFGIVSLLRKKTVNAYPDNDYFRLTISGQELIKYRDLIGFGSELRQKEFDSMGERIQESTNFDSIPHMGPLLSDLYASTDTSREDDDVFGDYKGDTPKGHLTYPRLGRIIDVMEGRGDSTILDRLRGLKASHYFYDPVVSVEIKGDAPVFDFEMPETHSFQANGIITHNTTICLHAIKEAQSDGELCVLVDAEHAFDPGYAQALGIDIDALLVSQPGTGEEALQIVDKLVRTGAVGLIVVDSVAALVPKAEIDGQVGDSHVGLQSRLMSQALRMIVGKANETGTTIIFTNQIRMKINAMAFTNPETTSGGQALKFYASQRLDVRRVTTNKDADGESVSNRTRIKIIKNKVAPPFREAEVDIVFGTGIDVFAEILDLAEELGYVERSGAWYSYGRERIGQGRDNAIRFLKEHESTFDALNVLVRKKLFDADPGEVLGLMVLDEMEPVEGA